MSIFQHLLLQIFLGMKREKNHENEISSSSHYPLIND